MSNPVTAKRRSPVRDVRTIIMDSGDPGYVNRILIATPTTGLVRVEWMNARYGQLIPCNWSQVQMLQYMSAFIPLRYQVADAQNLCVKEAIEREFEWLLLLEHDVVIPNDTFMRLNEYMRNGDYPIVSGLYFTRSFPSEPLIYRGRGNSFYTDWKMGDKVMVDGVPTGCLLIHTSILKALWDDSEEYDLGNGIKSRRVFDTPRRSWYHPDTGQFNATAGTSDLDWCTRVIEGGYLKKAGWLDFAEEHPRWPFLCDTSIFCWHINPDGTKFPRELSGQ